MLRTANNLFIALCITACATVPQPKPESEPPMEPPPPAKVTTPLDTVHSDTSVWPQPPKWGSAGFAEVYGSFAWADRIPMTSERIVITCPPGFAVYFTNTDSTGHYRTRLGLPHPVMISPDHNVTCTLGTEYRTAYDSTTVWFASTPDSVRLQRMPTVYARFTAAQGGAAYAPGAVPVEFSPLPIRAGDPIPPVGHAVGSDKGTIVVTGVLPALDPVLPWNARAQKSGNEVSLFLIAAPSDVSRYGSGVSTYRAVMPVPPGRYTVRVQIFMHNEPKPGVRPTYAPTVVEGVVVK